ncbi:hypothetical protein MN032_11010 [Agromyces atrinae]|uniref:hypothetical protein n=1 Tax=Agromyces atrinae TaxID=592376 RepID=UPI001F580837|nr:hypothetical protein [Agromyces atrinae]MCI2958227.1 hypothetical protein [Agromyces atrinae]
MTDHSEPNEARDALRRIWSAMGCAQNPDDFKPSVRAVMWGQVEKYVAEHLTGDLRLARENRELETVLREARAASTSIPTVEEFIAAMDAEAVKSIEKGYTPEHDRKHGPDRLLNWAIEYARRGKPAAAANLIQAARRLLAEPQSADS